MSPNAPIDADEVHVVDAAAARGSRIGFLVVVVLLLAVAGAGAWVVIEQPFASDEAGAPPPPAADNLLGQAWSFEAGEFGTPAEAWGPDDGAPAALVFGPEGAVSGRAAALSRPGEAGWAALVSRQTWRLPGRGAQVELGAVSAGDGVQLVARFQGEGLPDLDAVVASGRGELSGRVSAPPGYQQVAVVLVCVGSGSLDDVSLRLHDEGAAEPREVGVYEVFAGDPPGLTVLRGAELALRVDPPAVRPAEGRLLPGALAVQAGQQSLLLADGTSVAYSESVSAGARSLELSVSLSGAPAGARLVQSASVSGPLAQVPVGVRSARGYESFSGDFEARDVDQLILGRTQDRLVLACDGPFDLAATHRPDGRVALTLSRALEGRLESRWSLQGSFQQERLEAANLREEARGAEQAGRLGEALDKLQTILTRFPYDEQVLADASATRSRLELAMQASLDSLRRDLDDALFLGSAQRCKEVRAEAERLAERYAGSPAAEDFAAMSAEVSEQAASLLAEEAARRRGRVEALLSSFREHGGYPSMTAEYEEYLARHLDGGAP